MESPESRIAPSPEAASADFASPFHFPSGPAGAVPPADPAEAAYWRGVADGIARAGGAVPPEVAARAGPGAAADPADILAFDPVPLRHRADGLTPERQRAFVEALADCGVVREAAARVGVTEQSIARVRRRADARSFDRACEGAHRFGARRLRSIAFERAVEGTLKGHYYHGELISQERVYDNRLLVYLLGKTEHLLEPSEESRAVCDNWEAWMEAVEKGAEPPDAAPHPDALVMPEPSFGEDVWEDDDGRCWTSFPPPAGFDGEERGTFGNGEWYERTLDASEEAALETRFAAETAEEWAVQQGRYSRFFGIPEEVFSSSREAEPSKPYGPSGARVTVERAGESSNTAPPARSEGGSG